MPIPAPNTGESHDQFMSRCMANPTMNEEFPDASQRAAVCERQWNDSKAMPKFKTMDEYLKWLMEKVEK